MREHQQHLYITMHISSMRLSSAAAAEKSFQVTEISASLKIMSYSLGPQWRVVIFHKVKIK